MNAATYPDKFQFSCDKFTTISNVVERQRIELPAAMYQGQEQYHCAGQPLTF